MQRTAEVYERRSSAGRAGDDPERRGIATLLERVVVLDGGGAAALREGLAGEGITARVIPSASLATMVAGVIVLEIAETDADGLRAVAQARAHYAPIAVLGLGAVETEAGGLISREIDVVLPVGTEVALLARQIRALVRLLVLFPPTERPEIVTGRNIVIDLERREVRVGGKLVAVTPSEFRLLAHLARRPGRVVSHGELYRELHDHEGSDEEAKATLKVHIWRLRTKLNEVDPDNDPIVSVRGFGYMLERRAGVRRGDGS